MQSLELLAPAKNLDGGMAAIDHGADAVYIGPPQFGARAAAGNSIADIASLCDYAHQYGAKVYATVNTLLYDAELPQATLLLQQLADAHIDAVLIQDMRLIQACRQAGIPLHASTQADNRSATHVQRLLDQGFSRTVLARELSADEIAHIHQCVPQMELEVFVHGALCVSYSGLCFASEHCFGRSANRGECAQFCRMPFDLVDAHGHELHHQRHLLSLRDLNLSAHLGELIEAGATSFKIEGRLKDISYVKNVTAAYSQFLDSYIAAHPTRFQRASKGTCEYTFQPDLSRTFHRGYTTYFLHGRQPHIASFFTPKALGQQVGMVKELRGSSFTVAGTATFANGDGLCFFDADKQLVGFRVNRAEGNRLYPLQMPSALRPGTVLYRSNDQQLERVLAKPSARRLIPVSMTLRATADGFSLSINGAEATVSCPHQMAQKPQHERIKAELSRLGGTPYVCTQIDLPCDFPYFIPASQLSALRRMAVNELQQQARTPARPAPAVSATDTPATPTVPSALMQCRYCLRHELGCCTRHGGQKPQWAEPLSLRLSDGRTFRLEFDCHNCQMNVYAT